MGVQFRAARLRISKIAPRKEMDSVQTRFNRPRRHVFRPGGGGSRRGVHTGDVLREEYRAP